MVWARIFCLHVCLQGDNDRMSAPKPCMCEIHQMNRKRSRFHSASLVMNLLLFLPAITTAEETETESIHWAYGSILGTGWYKLDGDRQVYVLRIPPRWYYRDSSIDESGQRTLGIEFHFPLTFGRDGRFFLLLLGAVAKW